MWFKEANRKKKRVIFLADLLKGFYRKVCKFSIWVEVIGSITNFIGGLFFCRPLVFRESVVFPALLFENLGHRPRDRI